uniref:class I tRNA ligase family protein n=1 Tax=uncultured Winogradskyella sp. TaxID=395353 RepID=UPI00262A9BC3
LYIGGSEHATGHLLYSRFWVKFLYDRGFVGVDEPFKKLINQGMILGTSAITYRLNIGLLFENDEFATKKDFFVNEIFISKKVYDSLDRGNYGEFARQNENLKLLFDFLVDYIETEIIKGSTEIRTMFYGRNGNKKNISFQVLPVHVDVSFVSSSNELDLEAFSNWREDYNNSIFIDEKGEVFIEDNTSFTVGREPEKMSKSKYNVVNPDDIVEQYGADSLRLYEMFLGPLEQYKPWNTAGITGVHGFLKKLWKLFHQGENGSFYVSSEGSSPQGKLDGAALKTLHKTIKKVQEDIENFSFNTSVSTFMIAVNELTAQKCTSKEILEPLLVLISPYAPHIAEELWEQLGHSESISTAPFPKFEEKHLVESSKNYPISFNGKMRFTMELPLDLSKDDIEAAVMANEKTQEQLQGRTPKKVIVVPGKIVNIVG